MSQLFSSVLRQALTTFDRKNVAAFKINFQTLKRLVDQLSARDLNLDLNLLSEESFATPNKAPCTFVHIFQNADVTMSVFILRGDYTMPLHDHPMMHGILKTLSGSLRVQSFTRSTQPNDQCITYVKNAKEIQVVAEESRIMNVSSESAVLAPIERNYHEITALGGVSAFFDILSPPYDSEIPIYGRRRCSFFRKVVMNGGFTNNSATVDDLAGNELILERVSTPLSYFCDTGGYEPPDFLHDEIFKYDTTRENS